MKSPMFESEFSLDGYNIFSVNVGNKEHRGIMVYIDQKLRASQVDIPTEFQECLFVEINESSHDSFVLGTVYRSSTSSSANDLSLLELVSCFSKHNVFKKVDWGFQLP